MKFCLELAVQSYDHKQRICINSGRKFKKFTTQDLHNNIMKILVFRKKNYMDFKRVSKRLLNCAEDSSAIACKNQCNLMGRVTLINSEYYNLYNAHQTFILVNTFKSLSFMLLYITVLLIVWPVDCPCNWISIWIVLVKSKYLNRIVRIKLYQLPINLCSVYPRFEETSDPIKSI